MGNEIAKSGLTIKSIIISLVLILVLTYVMNMYVDSMFHRGYAAPPSANEAVSTRITLQVHGTESTENLGGFHTP